MVVRLTPENTRFIEDPVEGEATGIDIRLTK